MIRVPKGKLNETRMAIGLTQIIREKDVDMLIIREQYQDRDSQTSFLDHLRKFAIWVRNPRKISVDSHSSGNGFVYIRSKDNIYISFTPNEGI